MEPGVLLVQLNLPVPLTRTEVGNSGNRLRENRLVVSRTLSAIHTTNDGGNLLEPLLHVEEMNSSEDSELMRLVVVHLATVLVGAALHLVLPRLLVRKSLVVSVVLVQCLLRFLKLSELLE